MTERGANRASVAYWFDFVLFPIVAVAIASFDCRSLAWLGWCGAGVLLWTFVEYWMHRVALHQIFFHSTHERHHSHPSEYVVFAVWYTPLIFLAISMLTPASIFTGFVVGYCWFLVWHHILHHWDLGSLHRVRAYAIWHLRHHHDSDCNYGITTPIWDVVFRTTR